jgi:hypothetical protein
MKARAHGVLDVNTPHEAIELHPFASHGDQLAAATDADIRAERNSSRGEGSWLSQFRQVQHLGNVGWRKFHDHTADGCCFTPLINHLVDNLLSDHGQVSVRRDLLGTEQPDGHGSSETWRTAAIGEMSGG